MEAEEYQNEVSRLRQNIKIELDMCDPVDTPFVCANIKSDRGYQKIEEMIIQIILKQHVTIGSAIVTVETHLNLLSYAEY